MGASWVDGSHLSIFAVAAAVVKKKKNHTCSEAGQPYPACNRDLGQHRVASRDTSLQAPETDKVFKPSERCSGGRKICGKPFSLRCIFPHRTGQGECGCDVIQCQEGEMSREWQWSLTLGS